jgi:hypothetical protein
MAGTYVCLQTFRYCGDDYISLDMHTFEMCFIIWYLSYCSVSSASLSRPLSSSTRAVCDEATFDGVEVDEKGEEDDGRG